MKICTNSGVIFCQVWIKIILSTPVMTVCESMWLSNMWLFHEKHINAIGAYFNICSSVWQLFLLISLHYSVSVGGGGPAAERADYCTCSLSFSHLFSPTVSLSLTHSQGPVNKKGVNTGSGCRFRETGGGMCAGICFLHLRIYSFVRSFSSS